MKRYIRNVAGVTATLADGTKVDTQIFDGRAIKRTRAVDADLIEIWVEDGRGKQGIALFMTPAAYLLVKDERRNPSATTGSPHGSH